MYSGLHVTLLMNKETNYWARSWDFWVREKRRGRRRVPALGQEHGRIRCSYNWSLV